MPRLLRLLYQSHYDQKEASRYTNLHKPFRRN